MANKKSNELIVVTGRPGAGKTLLAKSIYVQIMRPSDLFLDETHIGLDRIAMVDYFLMILEKLKTDSVLVVVQHFEQLPPLVQHHRPLRVFTVEQNYFSR